jgi:hypothetical protein
MWRESEREGCHENLSIVSSHVPRGRRVVATSVLKVEWF